MPLTLHASLAGVPLHEVLKRAGVVGAGGAGFPTWAKYTAPQPTLVVNAQESEPGYFIDKWLHHTHAEALVDVLAWLREWGVQRTVVAAKLKDRPTFARMEALAGLPEGRAKMLDCTGRNRHVLDEQAEPVLFAYTDDRYTFGMETALLLIVAQKKIPQGERPSQHGVIVSNTETLWNIFQVLSTGRPVTSKFVHVYGATPHHTFRQVPIGTPAHVVIEDAGVSVDEIRERGLVVVDGGPGWFERVDVGTAVVSRRTNSFLVIDPSEVDLSKKDVLPAANKPGYPRAEMAATTTPSPLPTPPKYVVVPLQDNPAFKAVSAAVPCVAVGDSVAVGDRVAVAADVGISVDAHASIAGTVAAIDAAGIHIAGSGQ
jgi:Na+-translocating ferredoxin:NAD+ oxidoreductase RnfC subunit